MTMTDPIADMLTRIRNANVAFHDEVVMPSSKLKVALAKILEQEGYIAGFERGGRPARPGRQLRIELKYTPDRQRTISGHPPGVEAGPARVQKADLVPRVLGGMGISILSTNQGLMTDREARPARSAAKSSVRSGRAPCPESASSPSPSRRGSR